MITPSFLPCSNSTFNPYVKKSKSTTSKLRIGNAGNNNGAQLILAGSNTTKNWVIANQQNLNGTITDEYATQQINNTVEAAIDDPIKTIATVAAVSTGNAYLIPYINAADVVADGGSLGDAAKAFGTAYVSQGVANYVAADLSTADTFDTTPFSEQTRILAEQTGGMVPTDQLSTAIGSGAGAADVLDGGCFQRQR